MNKAFKQLIKAAHQVTLTSKERADIKHSIFEIASFTPVMPDATTPAFFTKTSSVPRRISSPYGATFGAFFHTHNLRRISLVVMPVLLFSITASTMFAAEGTIPGDALYGVKLNVNERFLSSITISPKSRAELEASFAERRLQEIEKIALRPNPSTQDIQALTDSFELHAQNYQDSVELVEAEDGSSEAAKVSADFKTVLDAHSKIIVSVASTSDSIVLKGQLLEVKNTVVEQNNKTGDFIVAAQDKADAEVVAPEGQIDPKVVADRIIALRIKIEYLKAFRSRVNFKAIDKAERLLKDITHEDGQNKEKRQMRTLDRADQIIQEALLIREVEEDLDIDIHATSSPATAATSTPSASATSTLPAAVVPALDVLKDILDGTTTASSTVSASTSAVDILAK